MKKNTWLLFDASAVGAEEVFSVRQAGGDPVAVVKNGHGQLLLAATRRLLEWKPAEMSTLSDSSDKSE